MTELSNKSAKRKMRIFTVYAYLIYTLKKSINLDILISLYKDIT
jgi:hypothetical protein